jgi:hypothetical protein
LQALDAVKTPRRGAAWYATVFIDAWQTGRKNLLKLVFKTHVTKDKPNARAGHGSAPGARKRPARDGADHTL